MKKTIASLTALTLIASFGIVYAATTEQEIFTSTKTSIEGIQGTDTTLPNEANPKGQVGEILANLFYESTHTNAGKIRNIFFAFLNEDGKIDTQKYIANDSITSNMIKNINSSQIVGDIQPDQVGGLIRDMNIADDAAIQGTKISPDFGSQNIETTGNISGNIAASNINSGTLSSARIPGLPASKITSGTFSSARLPTNIVYTDTTQTISGAKTFSTRPVFSSSIRIANGSQANGRVLTSDASGNATWQSLPTPVLPTNIVYTNTNQTISGTKTFSSPIIVSQGKYLKFVHSSDRDNSDGTIASNYHDVGLNLVGSRALNGQRRITTWGHIISLEGSLHMRGGGINSYAGHITAHNGYGFLYSSDGRLKENIKKIKSPLLKIQELGGYTFDWKNSGKRDVGLIAQEVEKVFPELVVEYEDEKNGKTKTVKYGNLVAPIIEAIKELADIQSHLEKKYTKLEQEVILLREENVLLEERLQKLEAMMLQ